jgi:hypothetical protein
VTPDTAAAQPMRPTTRRCASLPGLSGFVSTYEEMGKVNRISAELFAASAQHCVCSCMLLLGVGCCALWAGPLLGNKAAAMASDLCLPTQTYQSQRCLQLLLSNDGIWLGRQHPLQQCQRPIDISCRQCAAAVSGWVSHRLQTSLHYASCTT